MKVIWEEPEELFIPAHIVLESRREIALMKEILHCAGKNIQNWDARSELRHSWREQDVVDAVDLQARIWLEL